MDTIEDMSTHELLALKEVRLTSRLTNAALLVGLFEMGAIRRCDDDRLELTARGRNLLVRGLPALWSFALPEQRRAPLTVR